MTGSELAKDEINVPIALSAFRDKGSELITRESLNAHNLGPCSTLAVGGGNRHLVRTWGTGDLLMAIARQVKQESLSARPEPISRPVGERDGSIFCGTEKLYFYT